MFPGGAPLTARPSRPRPVAEAQRLVDLLSALGSTTFRQLLWQKSAELDLTYAQSQVLFYVAEHPGCHMGDVGKVFGVTLPAVTHLVDRLEQKGFVVRGDHPVDRRVHALETTAAGQTLADELRALQLRGVGPVLSRMSARHRQRLMEGLEALVEAAGEATGRAMDEGDRKGRRSNSKTEGRRLAGTLVLLGILILTAAGCGREDASVPAAKAAMAPEGLTVTAVPVQARDVERTVETTGSLLAWEEATVNTSVPGTIARLSVDLGDRVRAGQVVAEIETREFTLGVQQAEAALRAARDTLTRAHAQADAARANLQQVRDSRKSWDANLKRWKVAREEAQLNLERSRRLVAEELVAQRDLDAARTQYESMAAQYEVAQVEMGQYPQRVRVAEAELRSDLSAVQVAQAEIDRRQAELGLAEKRLEDATLRAPIDGAIARRHVNPGEYVKENVAVFSIVRSDPLKYSGVVSEHAALEIRAGQALRLEVDPVPGRAFTGRVTRVSPAVDVANRTVLLEAEVPNPDGLLKPGLFARGGLATRRDAAVPFVPEAAVSTFAGITKVFVLAGGKAQERSVKLGRKQDGLVEILAGVRAGEQVATSSLARLYDGAGVTVQARPRAKP